MEIYEAECWQQTSKTETQLKVLEIKCMRRSCRIIRLDHIRSDDIRQRVLGELKWYHPVSKKFSNIYLTLQTEEGKAEQEHYEEKK